MKRIEVIHILVDEFRNRYFRQISMRFVPNQSHREDVAQRSCDEVRVLANQQFEPSRKILICTHGRMKREIALNVTHRSAVLFRPRIYRVPKRRKGWFNFLPRRHFCGVLFGL
jgi:hypothetical protein